MIYLSSQPDHNYYIWQLLTQSENFKNLNISKDQIYALIAYNGTPNPEWEKFKDKFHGNLIFIPDTRISKQYSVSIRPNIIKQFLVSYPQFNNEYIFYHDADIVLSEVPLFEGMEDGRIHVSFCDYLQVSHFRHTHSRQLFNDLTETVGIHEDIVIQNDANAGGAQIYGRGLTYEYWDKVEIDCEKMFIIYEQNYRDYVKDFKFSNAQGEYNFQKWTFEMWSMLWNWWYFGYTVYANPLLEFCWPNTLLEKWDDFTIFHNSGVVVSDGNFFKKEDYRNKLPFNVVSAYPCVIDYGDGISKQCCQKRYLAMIDEASKLWIDSKDYFLVFNESDNLDELFLKFNLLSGNNTLTVINNLPNYQIVVYQDNMEVVKDVDYLTYDKIDLRNGI